MKAMILAAGRGERMRPLTDATPKPLLQVGGKALIEYSLERLVAAGFSDIVINIAYLGRQIQAYCGDGRRWDCRILYSDEGETALETAGGIAYALPLLGEQPFLVVNADIICDYPLTNLSNRAFQLAHLVMIANPPHHSQGDFSLGSDGRLSHVDKGKLTFSGIGLYHPALFAGIPKAPLKLRPILNEAIAKGLISGEEYGGLWLDIGTPQRLQEINTALLHSQ
jgi:N-acetyl-alpha-D-muramate 1-phosphate uridylyltransferase